MFRKDSFWLGNEYVVIVAVAFAVGSGAAVVGAFRAAIGSNSSPQTVTQTQNLPQYFSTPRGSPATNTYREDPTPAPEQPAVVFSPQPEQSFSAPSSAPEVTSSNVENFPGERFPQTRTGALSSDDINKLSPEDIRYAINEVFARRGAIFPKKDIRETFSHFAWYRPSLSLEETESRLPGVERYNVTVLGEARKAKMSPNRTQPSSNAFTTTWQSQAPPPPQPQTPPQPTQPQYPVASWSVYNGCVISPYSGHLVNVNNIQLGNLVTENETGQTFQMPSQPPNPEMYPVAQWSNVPGSVFSPYQSNTTINVQNFPAGGLVVDPTTNGVFRKPDGTGATAQVLGGLLQALGGGGIPMPNFNSGGGSGGSYHRPTSPQTGNNGPTRTWRRTNP